MSQPPANPTEAHGHEPAAAPSTQVARGGVTPSQSAESPASPVIAAEAALDDLDQTLSRAAATLAEPEGEAPAAAAHPAPDVSLESVDELEEAAFDATTAHAVPTPTPSPTTPPVVAEPADSVTPEFETTADIIAKVAASPAAVTVIPAPVPETTKSAAPALAVAATPAAESKSVAPVSTPVAKKAEKAKGPDIAAIGVKVLETALGVVALPLRLMPDKVRDMAGYFAAITMMIGLGVWGAVLFMPRSQGTSPVVAMIKLAEKEGEGHAEAAGGHGEKPEKAAGGHGAEAKKDAKGGHGAPAKAKAKKDAGHGAAKPKKEAAGHGAKPKKDAKGKKAEAAHH